MSKHKEIDLRKIHEAPLKARKNKVSVKDFAKPGKSGSFKSFWDSMPDILAAGDIRKVVAAVRRARDRGKPVIWFMGAHVIKVGLSPLIIDMMKDGFVTAVGLNGALVVVVMVVAPVVKCISLSGRRQLPCCRS